MTRPTNSAPGDGVLLQQIAKRLAETDFDFSTFTISSFAQWVSQKRAVPIHLEPFDESKRPAGFWFMSDDGAHVHFNSHLPPPLKLITILHELLHIYFGHKTVYVPNWLAPLVSFHPSLSHRDPLAKDVEDREAEIGAILLLRRINPSYDSESGVSQSQQLSDLFSKVADI